MPAATDDGTCACGHVLDRSTDELCRHCARSGGEQLARLARVTSGHGAMCPCRACTKIRRL
jgi:hypothetical protein